MELGNNRSGREEVKSGGLRPIATHPAVMENSKRIINEAVFIGLIRHELKEDYLSLASFSKVNLDQVKQILIKEKLLLTQEYDTRLRNQSLFELKNSNPQYYAKLYRAKFLEDPFQNPSP